MLTNAHSFLCHATKGLARTWRDAISCYYSTYESVLPVGAERTSNSSANTLVSCFGAAESAALDPDLSIVVGAWPVLAADAKSAILGIARKSANRG